MPIGPRERAKQDKQERIMTAALWGANTPSRRLTCDVLNQPNYHVASALATTEGLGYHRMERSRTIAGP
jgi:hypothetical protein